MKLIILLVVLLFASTAYGQSTLSININNASLDWQWTQGAPPNDGSPDEFRMKCGTASKQYSRVTSIPPTARTVGVRQAIGGSGNWFCAVSASNKFGESGDSNEVNFDAGAPPSAPNNLVVTAK